MLPALPHALQSCCMPGVRSLQSSVRRTCHVCGLLSAGHARRPLRHGATADAAACGSHSGRRSCVLQRWNTAAHTGRSICSTSGQHTAGRTRAAVAQALLDSVTAVQQRQQDGVATAEEETLHVDLREDRGVDLGLDLVPGVSLMLQPLRILGTDFNLIVPDVDAVMDAYISSGREDWDPYWARPWPSAAALAARLLQGGESESGIAGAAVAELGAGLGLAGLAAALAGAGRVVLMDREPLALVCAALSAVASGVAVEGLGGTCVTDASGSSSSSSFSNGSGSGNSASSSLSSGGDARDMPLQPPSPQQDIDRRQGDHETAASGGSSSDNSKRAGRDGGARPSLLPTWPGDVPPLGQAAATLLQHMRQCGLAPSLGRPGAGAVSLQTLDWGDAGGCGTARYDVLLACDVLYESYAVAPIAELAPRLLFTSGGRLLLADPAERTVHNRAAFVDLVGRGKVGLALQAEQQQRVAIDGQQPMMGSPASAAAAAASESSQPKAAMEAEAALLLEGQLSAAQAISGSGSGSIGGGSNSALQDLPADGSSRKQQGPGSVVAVRLMTFARGWAAGTVAPANFVGQ